MAEQRSMGGRMVVIEGQVREIRPRLDKDRKETGQMCMVVDYFGGSDYLTLKSAQQRGLIRPGAWVRCEGLFVKFKESAFVGEVVITHVDGKAVA